MRNVENRSLDPLRNARIALFASRSVGLLCSIQECAFEHACGGQEGGGIQHPVLFRTCPWGMFQVSRFSHSYAVSQAKKFQHLLVIDVYFPLDCLPTRHKRFSTGIIPVNLAFHKGEGCLPLAASSRHSLSNWTFFSRTAVVDLTKCELPSFETSHNSNKTENTLSAECEKTHTIIRNPATQKNQLEKRFKLIGDHCARLKPR